MSVIVTDDQANGGFLHRLVTANAQFLGSSQNSSKSSGNVMIFERDWR
jgi:hypothetical protein